jgi:hypothetical protein
MMLVLEATEHRKIVDVGVSFAPDANWSWRNSFRRYENEILMAREVVSGNKR